MAKPLIEIKRGAQLVKDGDARYPDNRAVRIVPHYCAFSNHLPQL
jgi:hypothetical protein